MAQWVWNLRLELGHQLHPDPVRVTEFAPAIAPGSSQAATRPASSAAPATATSWKAGRFTGSNFPLQADGTLRCPAGNTLHVQERRRETDGSLRVVYAANIRSCRPCPLREQCQWQGHDTRKPRQVSVLLHPLVVGNATLLWYDWSRRIHRRACLRLLRSQRVEVQMPSADGTNTAAAPPGPPGPLSRAERAHVPTGCATSCTLLRTGSRERFVGSSHRQ